MEKCSICNREFPNPRSLGAHKAWHTREKTDLASLLLQPLPTPFQKVDIDLSPEGHLKVSIRKESLTQEEIALL